METSARSEIALLPFERPRPFDKFEMDKAVIAETLAKVPDQLCEEQLEDFIDALRIRYGIRASQHADRNGAPTYTQHEIAVMFKINLD